MKYGPASALKAWSGALVLPKWVPVEGRHLTAWTIDWWRWIYTRSCTIPFGRPVLVEAQAVVVRTFRLHITGPRL